MLAELMEKLSLNSQKSDFTPETQIIDENRLHTFSCGDVQFERELLEVLVLEIEKCLVKIRTALQSGDVTVLKAEAHHIKGASANVGVPCMQSSAMDLERLVLDSRGDLKPILVSIIQKISELEQELSLVEQFITTYN
jgi:HPt (histidine-containing phosphotransfer) domain-containing protein